MEHLIQRSVVFDEKLEISSIKWSIIAELMPFSESAHKITPRLVDFWFVFKVCSL